MAVQVTPYQGSRLTDIALQAEGIKDRREGLRLRDIALGQNQQRIDQTQSRYDDQRARLTDNQKLEAAQLVPQMMLEAGKIASKAPEGQRLQVFRQQVGPFLQEASRQGIIDERVLQGYQNATEDHFQPAVIEKEYAKFLETPDGGLIGLTNKGQADRIDLGGAKIGKAPDEIAKRRLDLDREKFEAEKNENDGPAFSEDAQKLRKEFAAETKGFPEVNRAFGRIQSSGIEPSAAGDIALIFNFMKMLDPGSTVREGEFATAQNAGGVGSRIRALANSVANGQRLTEEQRADFLDRAEKLYGEAESQHGFTEQQFISLAERQGVDPGLVIMDRRSFQRPEPENTSQSGTIDRTGGPSQDQAAQPSKNELIEEARRRGLIPGQ